MAWPNRTPNNFAVGAEAVPAGVARVTRTPVRQFSELGPVSFREHVIWRKRVLAGLRDSRPEATPRESRRLESALDELSATLLSIAATVAATYGTPDLGNKRDPVDELVYIILSRRTREGAYQAAFEALKSRYETWEALVDAPAGEVEDIIAFSGLGRRKTQSLKLALGALLDRWGRCTLEPTRGWSDEDTRDFLCTLPEIGPKSAACVMVCALDRPAFPVDAHVGRVLERLAIFRVLDIELDGTDHKQKQHLLWDAVPPALRYLLHVNLLMHGRLACRPRKPRCTSCALVDHCAYGLRAPTAAVSV